MPALHSGRGRLSVLTREKADPSVLPKRFVNLLPGLSLTRAPTFRLLLFMFIYVSLFYECHDQSYLLTFQCLRMVGQGAAHAHC